MDARVFLVAGFILTPVPALAETRFEATLAGHAYLPALTLIAPPGDAPRDAWISGKFTGGTRIDRPMSVTNATGIARPFIGQPLQGFSGFAMATGPEGGTVTLSDNGFGSKANSSDALLHFSRVAPDWESGAVEVLETVFLSDPAKLIPHRIVHKGTEARYLTGADLDPESIQIVGDTVWIGEEFGPWLISADLGGKVTGFHPTLRGGEEIRGPDHPALRVPAEAGVDYLAGRSAGFEGLALNPGTGRQWALLERPLLGPDGAPEGDGLEMLEFDPEAGVWTGTVARLRLGPGAVAVGDFNFIDASRALVIERDAGQGDPSLACSVTGGDPPACFPEPAVAKRVVLIDMDDQDAEGFVRRVGSVDLMDIADPDGVARIATEAARDLTGRFTMPFTTIESVRAVDAEHVMVAIDNNLPFSTGRAPGRAADNEFVLLRVPELLAAE